MEQIRGIEYIQNIVQLPPLSSSQTFSSVRMKLCPVSSYSASGNHVLPLWIYQFGYFIQIKVPGYLSQ